MSFFVTNVHNSCGGVCVQENTNGVKKERVKREYKRGTRRVLWNNMPSRPPRGILATSIFAPCTRYFQDFDKIIAIVHALTTYTLWVLFIYESNRRAH